MRITFISPVVNMGGGTRVICIYANELKKMGHDVIIISPPARRPSIKKIIKSLIKGNGWPQIESTKSHLDNFDIKHHVIDMWGPVVNADVPDADVVIATWWETAEWINEFNESKGAKVYFVQGHEVYSHLPVQRCRATYKLPFHKIVISNWLKKIMRDEYNDTKVDLVLNSLDHKQFFSSVRKKQLTPTIGFLFNTNSCKGLDVTYKVITKLRNKINNLRIISFGSSQPIAGELENNIEFFHSPEQNKIRKLYSQCDVWLTSSRLEGFNLTAMEAMGCRTPVVSTKVGWPEEAIITQYNGMLTDIDDVDALVDATEKVLSLTDSEWEKMSENAYKTVVDSSWKKSAKLFEKSLMHACSRSKNNEISGKCEVIP